jgi:acyl-CoA thioesterase II
VTDAPTGAAGSPDHLDWLDLRRVGPGRYSLEVSDGLIRLDGQLYGGTGLAASVRAMAVETGRHPLWSTVQFAASATLGETLRIHVEELARGHKASQVRFTATVDDRLVLAALGTTGVLAPDGFDASFGEMPEVSAPADSEPWQHLFPVGVDADGPRTGAFLTAEFRQARRDGAQSQMWVRMVDHPQTRESIAYLADFVPAAVVRAAGRVGVGTSMDNSIRFGPAPVDTEWIFIDVDPYFGHGGFAHGAGRIWSEDGVLLAVASQTARTHLFD